MSGRRNVTSIAKSSSERRGPYSQKARARSRRASLGDGVAQSSRHLTFGQPDLRPSVRKHAGFSVPPQDLQDLRTFNSP